MTTRYRPMIFLTALATFLAMTQAAAQTGSGAFTKRTFEHDGYNRWYNLYVPSAYDGSEDWPLVISYHGFSWRMNETGSGSHPTLDNLRAVADTAGFLIAYPQGLRVTIGMPGGTSTNTGWNDDGEHGDWDDVSFTSALIDHVDADFAIDLHRVHATGMSSGSRMMFTTACRLSHRIASIGGATGPMVERFFGTDCKARPSFSILLIHGTDDKWFPYTGYPHDDFAPRPIPETPAFWADRNGCSRDSLVTDLPDVDSTDNSTVTLIEYPDCPLDTEVLFYRVNNGGHTWPGNLNTSATADLGTINMDIDASSLIWNFFVRHPHPDPVLAPSGWTFQWSGTSEWLRDISLTDAETGTVVGDGGTILRTTDGGTTWVHQASGTSEWLWGVFFTDANTGTVVGGDGTVLRTTDGGATWVHQMSGTSAEFRGVSLTDANTGTVVGGVGTILRTTDGGATWVHQVSGTSEPLRGVSFTDANTGTVVGMNGTILRTTDGGATWVHQMRRTSEPLRGVSFVDAKTGTVVGDGGTILRTRDGGTTWIRQAETGYALVDVCFTDSSTGTAVGGRRGAWGNPIDGVMLRTTDGGATWVERSALNGVYGISAVDFIDENTGIAVGLNGFILGTRTAGTSTSIENQQQADQTIPRRLVLHQNYPNPFNPTTTISYDLPESSDVRLKILDALGRTVEQLGTGYQVPGTYSLTFDASDLPSGVYFYRLEAGDYTETKGLILAK